MIDAERQDILCILDEGVVALAESLHGVDEVSARLRPASGGWSILGCVEHIAATEAALLSRLREAKPCAQSCEDRPREAKFRDLALNRMRRIEAPDLVAPKGDCQSLAQAMQRFEAVRSETVSWVRKLPGDLRWWLTTHPLITRPVNCHEMLLLMALHPRRHAGQIIEIRQTLAAMPGLS